MAGFGEQMGKRFLVAATIAALALAVTPQAFAQDDVSVRPAPPADALNPPQLPKLAKGAWTSRQTVFDNALSLEDADGNDLDKLFDLSGTTWSAHVDLPKNPQPTEAEDEDDPVSQLTEPFIEALNKKAYDYRVAIPETSYYLMGAADDGEYADVSGMSVIAQGKLRFIAITDRSNGDVEIFISDEAPVADLLQKISGKKDAP